MLFAVLAMQGLTSHELAHGGSPATALPVIVADDGHADPEYVDAKTGPAATGGSEPSPAPEHDLDGGVCLALLCLFAVLLSLVLHRGLHAHPSLVPRRVSDGLVRRGRPADPPCLYRLSIMRC